MFKLLTPLLISIALSSSAIAADASTNGGGIVYAYNGDGLLVETPDGWILDNQAMASEGIDMLFYPKATGFNGFNERTPVFAFVMPTYKGAPYVSVKGLIAMRTEQLKEADKRSTVVIEQPAKLDSRGVSTVTVVQYSAPSVPRYERVAYLEDSRTIYAVILSTLQREGLKKYESFIKDVINSHQRQISDQ